MLKISSQKVLFTIFFVSTSLFCSSCCTKKKCIGAEQLSEIHFFNFSKSDIDSVSILSYTASNILVDSINASPVITGTEEHVLHTSLDITLKYKIMLKTNGKEYNLSDFTTESEVCNKCLGSNDYYSVLSGYNINGQKMSGNRIEIFK